MSPIHKYPRTPHLDGSKGQPGDEDLNWVSLKSLSGRSVVIEEKLDGANAGISFSSERKLLLQSRGHYLTGGQREQQFSLFKAWAMRWEDAFWKILGDRYVLYGEWMFAKHTIYYDRLPHYFMEFDVLDVSTADFLSTPARGQLLAGLPLASVPVLHRGRISCRKELEDLIRPSLYKSERWREVLEESCRDSKVSCQHVAIQTDPSDLAEGLYIKVEEGGRVIERMKYVRESFLDSVLESESHWQDRPIVPNGLEPGCELY